MTLKLSPLQLRMINACCMYLQVTMLAEITDHTGTHLLPQATTCLNNNPPPGLHEISHSLLDWPVIHPQSISCWNVWVRTIKTLFTGDAKGNHLQTPLGAWHTNYQQHQFWKWQISPLGSLLYQPMAASCPQAALLLKVTRCFNTYSTMVPTNQLFSGPLVTPSDPYQCHVDHPIVVLDNTPQPTDQNPHFRSIIQQF